MKSSGKMRWVACGVATMACAAGLGLGARGMQSTQAPVTGVNPAVTPVDRLSEGWWAARHAAELATLKSAPDPEVILVGDSITQNYEKAQPPDENFQPTWATFYAPRRALNLGFSGDTTANLLWRLQHGEVDGIRPKVAVLMIGTNNTGFGRETAEQTESGIDAVVLELEHRLPSTHVLLLGILPSDGSAAKLAKDAAINRYLAGCYGENPQVTYLDVGSVFLKDGVVNTGLFYDPRMSTPGRALHPDTNGQRMMAEAVEPTLAKLLGEKPVVPLASMGDINTALIPVERLELDSYDWYARHHAELQLHRTLQPSVVMIGDSITHYWAGPPMGARASGAQAWQELFGHAAVLNMGFGYDRTQNVLWRLQQGEFDGLSPKWVVVNIGTNNIPATASARTNTPEEIAAGVEEICAEVHATSPQSRIVLMGIFPRGEKPEGKWRAPILAVNKLLAAHYASDGSLTFLDIGAKFLQPDGTLPKAMMSDGTHPTEAGYEVWAQALKAVGVGQ